MSREIKFRAWHNEAGEYCDGTTSNMFMWIESGQDVLLEQFTGLKDINGVEIYEGDILNIAFYDEFHNECVSIEGDELHCCSAKVCWQTDGYWLFIEKDSTWYVPLSLDECANVSVIGNILQNPELLS